MLLMLDLSSVKIIQLLLITFSQTLFAWTVVLLYC